MTPLQLVPLVVLCGAIALAGRGGGSVGIGSSDIANSAIAPAAICSLAMAAHLWVR